MTLGAFIAATAVAALATGCGGSTTTAISEIAAPDAVRCQTSLSTTPSTFPHGGSRVTLTVMAGRECAWTARSEASWAQVAPTSGQGEAALTVTIAANPDAQARSAALVVNDTRLSLTQEAAPCRIQLGRTRDRMSHEAGRTTVGVSAPNGCAWRALSNAPAWARVVTENGTGNGTVDVDVSPNPGGERTAVISIGDQTFTLVQEARPAAAPTPNPGPTPSPNPTCTITLDSAERSFGASGGEGSVRVVAPAGCAWTASASASWIDISGSNGTGTDTVRYSVDSNSSTSPRTATIAVAGHTHTVRQDGAPAGGGSGGEERIEISGRAFLVEGSCPNLSFIVDFRRVFTNGDTRFRGQCSRIRNGTDVSVEGRLQSDGRVRATEVRVRDDDDDEG